MPMFMNKVETWELKEGRFPFSKKKKKRKVDFPLQGDND
jgi:hypothetical protein